MKPLHYLFCLLALAVVLTGCGRKASKPAHVRLLYWNIQNGMWDGQPDNYDRFVSWVKAQEPDICVWCEAQSIWQDTAYVELDTADRYLPRHWTELAARYGHTYWYMGGHRDNYPQVITSKYPITNVARLTDEVPDSTVVHGAGWAQVEVAGKVLNLVTLHLWPMRFAFGVSPEEKEASAARREGALYRLREVEYICNHTLLSVPGGMDQYWAMMGDFNSKSRVDNHHYGLAANDSTFFVHDYIREHTPYVDVIAERYPGKFFTSSEWGGRLDFVYCTRPLYDLVTDARIVMDEYTTPVPDVHIKNFDHPSDHCPVIVDFALR